MILQSCKPEYFLMVRSKSKRIALQVSVFRNSAEAELVSGKFHVTKCKIWPEKICRIVLHSILIEWFPLLLSVYPTLTVAKCHWERMDTLGKRKHRTSRTSMTLKRFWERKYKNILLPAQHLQSYRWCLNLSWWWLFLPDINQLVWTELWGLFLCWPMRTWHFFFVPSTRS